MPSSEHSNGRAQLTEDEQGVLASLPRTRPQRATRRRLAAREAVAAQAAAESTETAAPAKAAPAPSRRPRPARSSRSSSGTRSGSGERSSATARAAKAPAARKRQRRATPSRRRGALEPAPRQGFESESEHPASTVQPPGGAELVAGAAEIIGELTRAGLAAGERVVKDVLSRLPLS